MTSLGKQTQADRPKNTDQLDKVDAQLKTYADKYRGLAFWWVTTYRTLVIASAVLSASAAVIVNLEALNEGISLFGTEISRSDLVSVLAASSTLMTTILGALGLEENWRVNRQARDRVRQLQLELNKSNPNYDLILTKLQETINDRVSDSFSNESTKTSEDINEEAET